jgi:nifR3 family TIM-barrel protein
VGGIGLCTTDLVNARSLLNRRFKAMELVQTCPEDTPLSIQIFGTEPDYLADAARLLESEFELDSIDINMGCPVAKVAGLGAGAALMRQSDNAVRLVQNVVAAVNLPVTVKMRLGWDQDSLTAPDLARAFQEVGVAAIAIHGRTREQGFSGSVDLDGIRAVVDAVDSIPVIGNGDILDVEDAATMFAETGCDGISIGRGALTNPWIFRQLMQWEHTGHWDSTPGVDQRLELLLEQLDYLIQQKGETKAIVGFRKMVHWYLKSMGVRRVLRHRFQQLSSRKEFDLAIQCVREECRNTPRRAHTTADADVPVPQGPNAHW